LGKCSPTSPASSGGHEEEENRSSLNFYNGVFGLEKSRIMEIVNRATEELIKMANMGGPLWVRSVETGREILNYDEYVKEFAVQNSCSDKPKTFIEASRDSEVVFMDLPRLLQTFLDVVSVRHVRGCIFIYKECFIGDDVTTRYIYIYFLMNLIQIKGLRQQLEYASTNLL